MLHRVVTGVKFEVKSQMIHLQIKEGQLMPGGRILNGTETWKPYENVNRRSDGQFYVYEDNIPFRLSIYQSNYARIGKNSRIIGLSNIIVPKHHVVTGKHSSFNVNSYNILHVHNICVYFCFMLGVRISYEKPIENYENFWPLGLEVRATPFDFITGQLTVSEDSQDQWIRADWPNVDDFVSANYEKLLKNREAKFDTPLQSSTNTFDSNERYAIFEESDLKTDAGQTTVPLFDAQPNVQTEGFALNGIGLLRKGKNSGGFLTMKIFNIDISEYM